jgi:hypothetical protein
MQQQHEGERNWPALPFEISINSKIWGTKNTEDDLQRMAWAFGLLCWTCERQLPVMAASLSLLTKSLGNAQSRNVPA